MNKLSRWGGGLVAIAITAVVFLVPFAFIALTASKTAPDAANLGFSWPEELAVAANVVLSRSMLAGEGRVPARIRAQVAGSKSRAYGVRNGSTSGRRRRHSRGP